MGRPHSPHVADRVAGRRRCPQQVLVPARPHPTGHGQLTHPARGKGVSPSAVVFPALPSGTRVPGTLATSLLVGHRLRSLAGTRPLSTEVSDLTEQLQSLPSLLNHLHPEGLGSARHYTWRHRLLRPQLPISAPPLDFPCGYTSGPAIRDSLGWSRDLPHFARWSVSPCHPPSTPGAPTGAYTQFFPVDISLRRALSGSATPSPQFALSTLSGSWWVTISRLNRFAIRYGLVTC